MNNKIDNLATSTPQKTDPHTIIKKMTTDRIRTFISTILISLTFILIFGLIGYQIDQFFQTKPIFLFIALAISFITNQFFLAKNINRIIKRK